MSSIPFSRLGLILLAALVGASVRADTARPPVRLGHFDAMGKPVVFPDGTVALYFIDTRGPGLAPTPAVQDLRVRLSKDNGGSWSDYSSLFTFPAGEGGFGFHDALVDREGKGAGLTSRDGSADGRVLGLQKVDPDWPCVAVWNFPSAHSGSLKLRVLIEPGFGGATLMLTDHFSVPFDAQDSLFSVYRVSTGDLRLAPDRWIDLELRWSGPKRACAVALDGRVVAQLPELRENAGSNYLRLRCDSPGADQGRLLIDAVEMKAAN